ncbi:hypothetical protein MRX96_024737 [Rhipicephalus microplus]
MNGEGSKIFAMVSSTESRWRQSRAVFGREAVCSEIPLADDTSSDERQTSEGGRERGGRRRSNRSNGDHEAADCDSFTTKTENHSSSSSSQKGSPLICVQTLGKPVPRHAT